MNALADCVELIYNKLGLFKLERLTIIIDCYYHYLFIYKFTCLFIYLFTYLFIYFCHLRCLYNNIYKQTCQTLNYLFNLNIYLPVFVSFVVLLEEFHMYPADALTIILSDFIRSFWYRSFVIWVQITLF